MRPVNGGSSLTLQPAAPLSKGGVSIDGVRIAYQEIGQMKEYPREVNKALFRLLKRPVVRFQTWNR